MAYVTYVKRVYVYRCAFVRVHVWACVYHKLYHRWVDVGFSPLSTCTCTRARVRAHPFVCTFIGWSANQITIWCPAVSARKLHYLNLLAKLCLQPHVLVHAYIDERQIMNPLSVIFVPHDAEKGSAMIIFIHIPSVHAAVFRKVKSSLAFSTETVHNPLIQ